MTKEYIFDRLWVDYIHQNPIVNEVYQSFCDLGEEVINDHIALRTFNDPRINIEVLSRPFIEAGYREKGEYVFEEKHLKAKHFEHISDTKAPRVFISELVTEDFSPFLQEVVKKWIDQIPETLLSSDELIFSGNKTGAPSFSTYEKLRDESEYAAWLYVNGFCANHFTVSVNYLKNLKDIFEVNNFLKDKGFLMNDSGGEVKGTAKELLRQSSIKSGKINIQFVEGVKETPGCYYEFAERFEDANGQIYSGFIAKSADKIFESTDFYKG
ncbi:MAG: DUF1338 domain-containing protein [Bacteroidetes bacterium HGW-Bacteroidetes-21]|jgi:hypothetical protein|nr:MAG: DUF1338 domain-containing protein [Bacteroidetes bacterium HGW-Bacteroidetes-21]